MSLYPPPIQRLIELFSRFPGIGEKSAARFVFYLLKLPEAKIDELTNLIKNLKNNIRACGVCHNFSENDPCQICRDPKRLKNTVCIVAKPQDLTAIEKSGQYQGLYHILGGILEPLNNIAPENLNIKSLLERLKKNQTEVKEIILSLNPDIEGETTSLYLHKLLKQNFPHLKITKLARGLPMGADIEYADDTTIANALQGRKEF